jgi:hypothetical protein
MNTPVTPVRFGDKLGTVRILVSGKETPLHTFRAPNLDEGDMLKIVDYVDQATAAKLTVRVSKVTDMVHFRDPASPGPRRVVFNAPRPNADIFLRQHATRDAQTLRATIERANRDGMPGVLPDTFTPRTLAVQTV